jgi:hypothetical protein
MSAPTERRVTSWDIEVGDIISERGIISQRWDNDYPDDGEVMNEMCRYIILEKVMVDPMSDFITLATKFYFKVTPLYRLKYLREFSPRSILTDYEIDTEDFDTDGALGICVDFIAPREWIRLT